MMIARRLTTVIKKLLIVDDQILVAEGLASLMQDLTPGWLCVPVTSSEAAGREAVRLRPDVVLADPLLPGDVRFQWIRGFAAAHPMARLVFLDDHFRPMVLRAALVLKTGGYWTKQSPAEEIVGALRSAALGQWTACPEAHPYVVHSRGQPRFRRASGGRLLTPRELAVARLLAQGMPVKQCARHLKLSPNTVDNHKSRLMKKLGLHRLSALVLWAVREGLA